jgi:phosphatidylserine/phosphatidylglycerophosphate/cardiolipin synthase-like enzyme
MANSALHTEPAKIESQIAEVVFARSQSIAEFIKGLLAEARVSIDAALHRFNSQVLAQALLDAHARGVRIRLLTDRSKYSESAATQRLLSSCGFPIRVTHGRDGEDSKMHHKFAVLDGRLVITGSYNWTFASEQRNHENVVILREPKLTETYLHEFETLWSGSDIAAEPEGKSETRKSA